MILTSIGLIEIVYAIYGTFWINDGIYLSWALNGIGFIITDFGIYSRQPKSSKSKEIN